MNIGIFGGSFDPVHFEHINMAESAIRQFNLDKLIIVPSFLPPHKISQERESFEARFEMLKIAFAENSKVEISDFESRSLGVSYTYITIEHFASVFSGAQLFFMVGTDMLADFPSWRNPQRILSKARLIVTPRKGDNLKQALDNYYKYFTEPILQSDYVGETLSSTKLRVYLKLGLSVDKFCPKSVVDYIASNGLFKGDKYYDYIKSVLPEKRRKHTANVVVKAIELATKLGADKKRAELSALLHDVAKYMSVQDFPEFALPSGVPSDVPNAVMHQFLGAFVCETVLKISDEEILNSVRFHTTGRENMSLLEKIVFISDLIEEDRDFDGVDSIRDEIDKDFENGFVFALSELVKFLGRDGEEIYPLTTACLDYYKKIKKE